MPFRFHFRARRAEGEFRFFFSKSNCGQPRHLPEYLEGRTSQENTLFIGRKKIGARKSKNVKKTFLRREWDFRPPSKTRSVVLGSDECSFIRIRRHSRTRSYPFESHSFIINKEKRSGRPFFFAIFAERVGFEPTDRFYSVNTLAVCPFRPLRHLSLFFKEYHNVNHKIKCEDFIVRIFIHELDILL